MLDFEIGVYAANEAPYLGACLQSIDHACVGHDVSVNVILNGTRDNSIAVLKSLRLEHAGLRVFMLPFGDKSNAINTFFYELRRPARVCVQIDGYTRISPGSLGAVRDALLRSDQINIVSTAQASGRSAEAETRRTLAGGKCTGGFHALRPGFVDRIVAAGLRLPLRLYRGDGLLGSMAAHDLDPIANPWDNERVVGIREAQFSIVPYSAWRWRDLRRRYRREIRQTLGRLENEAIKEVIYRRGYAGLPMDAHDLVRDWLTRHDLEPRSAWERFKLAQAKHSLAVEPFPANRVELVFEA